MKIIKKVFLWIVLFTVLMIGIACSDKTEDIGNGISEEDSSESEPAGSDDDIPEASGVVETSDIKNTEETNDTEDSETSETETERVKQMENYPPGYNMHTQKKYYSYLTGLQCTRKEQLKRPVAIMINNIKAALPNVGTSNADIIYECTVEGGITRLMMVLTDYEDVPVFGSVRSSRDYYIDLAQIHDAIYIHAGGSSMAYDELYRTKIDRMDGVNMHFPNTFYRDAQRRKTMSLEHTMMTSGNGIIEGIKQQNYRSSLKSEYRGTFKFKTETKDIGGINNSANYICVPYSNSFKPEFIYNPDDKLYYRKQYGAVHIDGATGEQIKFDNVIILFAEYTSLGRSDGGLACKLTGDGYGFYINGGKYIIIKWQRDTRESVLNLYNTDNSELYLNPGKSFICITSKSYNKSVVISSDIKDVQ